MGDDVVEGAKELVFCGIEWALRNDPIRNCTKASNIRRGVWPNRGVFERTPRGLVVRRRGVLGGRAVP